MHYHVVDPWGNFPVEIALCPLVGEVVVAHTACQNFYLLGDAQNVFLPQGVYQIACHQEGGDQTEVDQTVGVVYQIVFLPVEGAAQIDAQISCCLQGVGQTVVVYRKICH